MDEEFYIALIQKRLNKSITDQEDQELNTWINTSKDNREMYEDIQLAWSEIPNDQVEVDTIQEWERLEEQIREDQLGKVFPLKRLIAIAASVLVLLSAFYFLNRPFTLTIKAVEDNQLVVLPDQSEIFLAKGSELQYEEGFQQNRSIELLGEARLSVTTDPSHPFTIHGPDILVTVLGTEFIYADFMDYGIANVQLIEGAVSVKIVNSSETHTLKPGEQFVLNENESEIITNLNLRQYDWLDIELNYNGETLSKVISDIEHYYGVSISADDIDTCKFSGNLSDMSVEAIMANIAALYGSNLSETESQYILQGGTCQ